MAGQAGYASGSAYLRMQRWALFVRATDRAPMDDNDVALSRGAAAVTERIGPEAAVALSG